MQLSFLPGEFELTDQQGEFVIRVQSKLILRTRSKQTVRSRFSPLRLSMEQQFPAKEVMPICHTVLSPRIAYNGIAPIQLTKAGGALCRSVIRAQRRLLPSHALLKR